MSAATDEAEDGPLEFNDAANGVTEETSQYDEDEQTREEELHTPKLSRQNRVEEEDDSLASNNDVESEEFGSLQASSPVPERPSSADGSLSIPDDSPSLQVSSLRVQDRQYSNLPRVLSNHPLQAEGSVSSIMAEVQRLLYGPLISAFKLAYPLLH